MSESGTTCTGAESGGAPSATTGGARRPRPVVALAAVCLGFFMVLLDGSALNIALPTIGRDVDAGVASLQWVVTIYTIPLAGLLLTAGSLADRSGSRRVFCWSIGGFTLMSLACASSPTLATLIASRGLQGVAAAGLLPTTLAIISRTYPDPVRRARAITSWGATGGLALVSGPLLGGALTGWLGWRAIFVINLPVGLATLAMALRHVAESPRRPTRSLDVPGQALGILALTCLVAGLIEGGSWGWDSAAVIALLATAALLAAGFLAVESRSEHPMLPLAMFRRAAFSASVSAGFAFQFAGYGSQFMLALYLQDTWHLPAARAGVLFLPFGALWIVGTLVLGRALLGLGHRRLLWMGATIALVGALITLRVDDPGSWPAFLVGTGVLGLGCGLFAPSVSATAMLAVDEQYAGLGSGVLNTARQVGTAVGVALLGALVALSDPVVGMHIGMLAVAACLLLVILLGVTVPDHSGSRSTRGSGR